MSPHPSIAYILSQIPYAQTLGVTAQMDDEQLILSLPYKQENIGNPLLPALHGGAIGGFMEIAAIAQIVQLEPHKKFPKPIGIHVDYLRRGRPVDTYASAMIARRGSRVTNVRVHAWQDNYDNPIATLHGHFLTSSSDE